MKTGGRLIVDALEANGADRVYCVPGESYLASLVFDALEARGRHPARSQTNAAKRQEVIAYGSKRAAVYF